MKKLLLFIFIAVSLQGQLWAQLGGQARIDSLLGQLPKAIDDTNKVKLLIDLSHTYYSINADEGLKFGKQGLALAQELNWEKGIGNACRTIAGNYSFGKSDYATALKYSLQALEQFKEIGDKLGTARILSDIGVIHWYQANYPNALKYYFDALRINEEINNKPDIAVTLCNIGIVYNSQKEYQKALEYLTKANKIDEEMGNKSGIAANLGDIGELYRNLNNQEKALEYELKSLQLYKELGDKNGIARDLGNIGGIYSHQKNYSKALECHLQSLKISEELGVKIETAASLGNIGNIYLETAKDTGTGKYNFATLQKAKIYIDSAIQICKEIGDLNALSANYKQLSEIQMLLGDNKSALASYKNFALLKDSIFNIEKDKKLTETAMQYAFDKKEAAARAEQEKKDIRQRNIRNSIIAGAVVLLLLLIAFINRYRYKQKANELLATAYENLKNTQEQLVQSERMAAFGVMASRMAHEIQNPLNFVNNFSELSVDLAQEIITPGNEEEKKEVAQDLISNLEKINHHGKRAAAIITQLQEHARLGTAQQFFEEE
ncbi:tetratricopeptide repeat protein [Ginsengibacter hankyongi]|uniref:histidine kinase n=1 Tax=Ginsengibacter hankyongi TaxID=2607284 RepID=A0A5J5IAM2_9BACT|nr:tetratricopeptide repeat protein [Ginsengibacter hankyongi]KAA9034465.1 tetratricopeptide repeat protein [Ginsengibacter hankyongi]